MTVGNGLHHEIYKHVYRVRFQCVRGRMTQPIRYFRFDTGAQHATFHPCVYCGLQCTAPNAFQPFRQIVLRSSFVHPPICFRVHYDNVSQIFGNITFLYFQKFVPNGRVTAPLGIVVMCQFVFQIHHTPFVLIYVMRRADHQKRRFPSISVPHVLRVPRHVG